MCPVVTLPALPPVPCAVLRAQSALVVPLLRSHFYATETSSSRNRVFSYRRPVWSAALRRCGGCGHGREQLAGGHMKKSGRGRCSYFCNSGPR